MRLQTRKAENVRASSEFRDCFPLMDRDLQLEKLRLSGHYANMVKWHGESEQHKRTAAKLCDDWDKYPKRDFNYFP
ncbi:hypothetical protein M5689_011071 [Euphorbia peplus]|nr:hypothetical protein M5689_011071 [Euphorbia peplus]